MPIEIADVVIDQPIEPTWGNQIRDRSVLRYSSPASLFVNELTPQDGSVRAAGKDLFQFTDGGWRQVMDREPTSWTPVLRGSTGNPSVGSTGTTVGRWWCDAGEIFAYARFTFNGTGIAAGSGLAYMNLPFVAHPDLIYSAIGTWVLYDASNVTPWATLAAVTYAGSADAVCPNFGSFSTAININQIMGGNQVAAGDTITVTVRYPLP